MATDVTVLGFLPSSCRYEALIKDVRTLEGQLADYNLAMDKSRTSTVQCSSISTLVTTLSACSPSPLLRGAHVLSACLARHRIRARFTSTTSP